MRIDFIRHGHCVGNVFFRGRSPAELSELGQKQMRVAFESIDLPDLVVSSPAKRCITQAETYYLGKNGVEKFNVPEVQLIDDFQERDFGVWDGLSYEAIQLLDPKGFKAYLAEPFDCVIAEGESLQAFEERVQQAFAALLKQATSQQMNHLLVVTHGGVMRVLLKQVLSLHNDSLFQFEIGFGARMALECVEMIPEERAQYQNDYFIKLVELVQNPLSV